MKAVVFKKCRIQCLEEHLVQGGMGDQGWCERLHESSGICTGQGRQMPTGWGAKTKQLQMGRWNTYHGKGEGLGGQSPIKETAEISR